MKAGLLLLALHDVVGDLITEGILSNTGDFLPLELVSEVKMAQLVELRLKQRGVQVPADIDRVINALPLFLSLVTK